jgi:hypothetical protein
MPSLAHLTEIPLTADFPAEERLKNWALAVEGLLHPVRFFRPVKIRVFCATAAPVSRLATFGRFRER